MKKVFTALFLGLLVFSACSDEWKHRITDESSVSRGFTVDILRQRGNYDIFLKAIEKCEYSDLFNGKGLSTAFVPDDDAFKSWLAAHAYTSIDDVPVEDLKILIGVHVVRYSYNLDAFLDFQPDNDAEHQLPGICYKHRTIAQKPIFERFNPISEEMVKVCPREKYLPVFNTNMFASMNITDPESNYKYFYPNSNWYGNDNRIYPANAGVKEAAIPTDNGYLYLIDQVIEPQRTVYEVMDDSTLNYSVMRDLYDKFPRFEKDDRETKRLTELYGAAGETIYPFYFSKSTGFTLLDIGDEWTHTLEDVWQILLRDAFNGFVPNDQAMNDFFNSYWGDPALSDHYDSYDNLDRLAMYYLISNHFVKNAGVIFPKHIREGLYNIWGYPYDFDPDNDVEHKEICGNGAFYGVNKVLVPAIFESVVRPAFQTPRYRTFSYLLNRSGLLPSLANKERELTLFMPSNETLEKAKYTLNITNEWDLSTYQVKSGTSTLGVSDAENLVKGMLISGIVTPEMLADQSKQTWFRTNANDIFVKVGQSKITTENGTDISFGVDEFNTDGKLGTWRVYEVNGLFSPAKQLLEEIEDHTEWKTWIKNQWKENIVKHTTQYPGNFNDNLLPFAESRGVIFATLNDWGKPGTNGIPKTDDNNKRPLSDWLGKHIISRKQNPELDLLPFIEGTVFNTEYKTMIPDFNLRILSIEPIPDDDPYKSQGYGTSRIRIKLPVSENERVVYAYGPLFTRDCLCYIIPDADYRFVWEEEKDKN